MVIAMRRLEGMGADSVCVEVPVPVPFYSVVTALSG
jgi:hypothetical protein